jgi:hypothetical protein
MGQPSEASFFSLTSKIDRTKSIHTWRKDLRMDDESQIVFELGISKDKTSYQLTVTAPDRMTFEEFLTCLGSYLLDEQVDETVDTKN